MYVGRWLLQWLADAGFDPKHVSFSAAPVVYSVHSSEARRAWGEGWAERCLSSAFGKQAVSATFILRAKSVLVYACVPFCQVSEGLATVKEMEAISLAWRVWSAEANGLFYYVNGQAIATVAR